MTAAMPQHDPAMRRRAVGAGLAMLVVALTYEASRYGDSARNWAAGAAFVVGIALADALVEVRRVLPMPGAAPLTIVGALVAAALCVPETDQLPIVALLPCSLVVLELVQRRQVEIEWYAVAAFAVGWGAMYGATGRQSALVGALFAWWAVILPAIVQIVRPVRSAVDGLGVAAVASIAAVVMARTGGIADTRAAVVVAGVLCAGVSSLVAFAIASGGDGIDDDDT